MTSVALVFALVSVQAQTSPDLFTLFPRRAPLSEASVNSFCSVRLTSEVLREVERDLSDIRLLDQRGQMVPFVVRRSRGHSRPEEWVQLTQISASREERPGPGGAPHFFTEVGLYELKMERKKTPHLRLQSARPHFVRSAIFEVLGAQGRVLERTESSVFRLENGSAARLEAWLPALSADAARLKVTLTGQDDGFVSPVLFASFHEERAQALTLEWPVPGAGRREGQATLWTVHKPRGFAATRLKVATSTPWFNRAVTIRSAGVQPSLGRVFRIPGVAPAENLEVELEHLSDEELEVRIDDLDSPPLQDLKLSLLIEQPELVFMPPGDGGLHLYFGGQRTQSPRFDTAGLPREVAAEELALGAVELNPEFISSPPLAAFRVPGAGLRPADFEHQAPVQVEGHDEGVVTLALSAAHAATLRPDFRDLRVVDAHARQWPYLLAEGESELMLTPTASAREGTSTYRFHAGGRLLRLSVVPPPAATFFSRRVVLRAVEKNEAPRELWGGDITYNPTPKGEPTQLEVSVPPIADTGGEYELVSDDLSNAPLGAISLRARVATPTLTTLLPAGDYRLMWGNARLKQPGYDLNRVAGVLQELRSVAANVGAPQANPDFQPPSLLERTGGAGRWAFWASLLLAVVVLSLLGLRVARQEGPPPGG